MTKRLLNQAGGGAYEAHLTSKTGSDNASVQTFEAPIEKQYCFYRNQVDTPYTYLLALASQNVLLQCLSNSSSH